MRLQKVTSLIQKIHDIVGKADSFNIVCHGQGCHFALSYAKEYPNRLESIHMIQPTIVKQASQIYLNKDDRIKGYMKDINLGYGAMFFPKAHEEFLQSFPKQQPIPPQDIFLYLSSRKAKGIKKDQIKDIHKIDADQQKLNFLEKAEFWTTLEKNILAK